MVNQIVEKENENNLEELQDKNLQCIRVEINTHVTVFLYYKKYPKQDSKKFPQERSAIVFYFDSGDYVNEKFIWTYFSLAGQVEDVEFGSYINKKGSKKKRRVVNFAIVKFLEEEDLQALLNRYEMQMKINSFLETRKNRNINLDYDPLKDVEDEEEDEVDDDGFVTVRKDVTKKRFNKQGLSFKVSKKTAQEDEDKLLKKEEKGDFYWNFQLLDKKRQSKSLNLTNFFFSV
jgi:hypothetical protein